ncbi:hypothetical protein D3C74_368860 [compost metagenome]
MRILRQRPGQKHPLLLTARQLTDLTTGILRHSYLGQTFHGDLPLIRPRAAEPTKLAITPHHHHIQRMGWEIPIDRFTLGHISDQLALFPVGAAIDAYFSVQSRKQP